MSAASRHSLPSNHIMPINYQVVEDRANALYVVAKLKAAGRLSSLPYLAPEQIPQIASEQVKCFFRALIDELNSQPTTAP